MTDIALPSRCTLRSTNNQAWLKHCATFDFRLARVSAMDFFLTWRDTKVFWPRTLQRTSMHFSPVSTCRTHQVSDHLKLRLACCISTGSTYMLNMRIKDAKRLPHAKSTSSYCQGWYLPISSGENRVKSAVTPRTSKKSACIDSSWPWPAVAQSPLTFKE